ncbi:hypothetical protein [Nocardia sp. SC052]|uniref:hypothetical protein n=1 Tax=Nocardia sichangensis TaxID=3385975 RepID=UPI0039A25EA9
MSYHSGRCWPPGTAIEDECPCPKEACGLVDLQRAVPECEHHPFWRAKSMRQGHRAEDCPGTRQIGGAA